MEPLEPGHDLILRELGSLLTEEHVVGPEIAAGVHVLGRQSVHGVVHHIQDERLLAQLQVGLPDAESSQLRLQLSPVGAPGFVMFVSVLDLGDLS